MSKPGGSTIDRVEVWQCRVPLDPPLALGSLFMRSRDFVILRVRTVDGVEGVAYALTRGGPVDFLLGELLAPLLLGKDALNIPRLMQDVNRSTIALENIGLLQRALSLIDICLWDIKGKAAGQPVWKLLGGHQTEAPVMYVAPYALADESPTAYAERLAKSMDRGYARVKVYPANDALVMRDRLKAISSALGHNVGIVVDAGWLWNTADEALRYIEPWQDLDLAWLEDPMTAEDWRAIKGLRSGMPIPVGVGDEVTQLSTLEKLVAENAVDVIRIDATTIGGYTGFQAAYSLARDAGLGVSSHVYPEIHRHCAYAWPGAGPIEMYPPGSTTWGFSTFLVSESDLDVGESLLRAPTEPGVGVELNWEAVRNQAIRAFEVTDGGT